MDDAQGWEPIENPYPYTEERMRKDRKALILALREFFYRARLRRHVLRQAAFKNGPSVRYKCASCSRLFKERFVEVDHKKPLQTITLKKQYELAPFMEELSKTFFGLENLQVLCRTCHRMKTLNDSRKTS